MADSAQDRTLPATPRRLQKAREEGQVPRSRDLVHCVSIAAGTGLMLALAPRGMAWLQDVLARGLTFDRAAAVDPDAMLDRLAAAASVLLVGMLPFGLAMAAVALGLALVNGGWNWTWKPLAPNFGKLNPLEGLPRLFKLQPLLDALRACLLGIVLLAIGASYLRGHLDAFSDLVAVPLPAAWSRTAETVLGGHLQLLLALVVFAVIDVPLQRHLHAGRLKMSHEEVKQEHKEAEGNAEVKSKIKVRMREMSRRRMMAAVPHADMVVMNPTHYAVALKYDEATMAAPRVVAKGTDLLAFAIRDTARNAKVPVLQAPVLARALYAHAEIDREIPAALFAAVAQVLAYVYQLRAALSGRGAMPGELPSLAVPAELDPHHVKVEQ